MKMRMRNTKTFVGGKLFSVLLTEGGGKAIFGSFISRPITCCAGKCLIILVFI